MIKPSTAAELVLDFANTVDIDAGTDELAGPAELTKWMAEHDLVSDMAVIDERDHQACLQLRSGMREALNPNAVPQAEQLTAASLTLARLPVLVAVSTDTQLRAADAAEVLTPSPLLSPTRQGIARLAIAWAHTAITGETDRLKRCAEDACGWVFWDQSKNHSRRWCSMRVCGNRVKASRYAARKRGERPPAAAR